jgi:glutaconate CoA-transferase subunit B
MDVTNKELRAIFISRIIQNHWHVIAGIGAPIPRAGIILAHLTHCPDLRIVMSDYFVEFLGEKELRDFTSYSDPGLERNAESTFSPEVRYETARLIDLMFLGGIQIDKFGNTNLIGIGTDFKSLKLRGAGSIGAPSMASLVKRYIIFSNNHDVRTFVDHCDFISTVGWYKGGDSRRQLGLPGGGPVFVITPLCIMDFSEDAREMRVKYLMPDVKKEDVIKNTGFDLIIPKDISVILQPSEREIEILRKRVDPKGLLRT